MPKFGLRDVKAMGLAAAIALAVGCGSAAFAGDTLNRLQDQGYARIAIANEPPVTEVTPDGKVTGAAPEVVRAVLKELGVDEVVASVSEYGAMIPGVQSGRFDIVAAGLFIRPERCKAVLFAEPDMCSAEAFAVKAGNPLGLQGFGDVAKHASARIAVLGGTSEEKLATDAGVPRDRIQIAPDGQSGLKMLQDGRVDVFSLPTLSISDLLSKANDPGLEMIAAVNDAPIGCSAPAFRREDRALRDAYDAAYAKLKEAGVTGKIVQSFGFPEEITDTTSREKLCGGPN